MNGDLVIVARTGAPVGGPSLAASSDENIDLPVAAQQVTQPLVTLAAQPVGGSVIVRLHPAELGQVEIQLERTPGGATRVILRAERPDTLKALSGERQHIEAALDRAGVPAAQRSVAFESQGSEQAATRIGHEFNPSPMAAAIGAGHSHNSSPMPSAAGATASPAMSQGGLPSGGGGHANGQGRGNQGGQQSDPGTGRHHFMDPDEPTCGPPPAGHSSIAATGVDITA